MLRRKLFVYSVIFCVGITSGYLMFEANNIFLSGLLIITSSVGIYINKWNSNKEKKDKLVILLFLILGFIIFTNKYIEFNSNIYSDSLKVNPLSQGKIEGKVTNIEVKDERLILTINEESLSGLGKVRVSYYSDYDELVTTSPYDLLGRYVKCYGEIREPSSAENPNCFNYRNYLRAKGIRYLFNAKYISVDNHKTARFWEYKRYLIKSRETFLYNFTENSGVRGFIKGVIFGDKSNIDEEIIEEFSINSTGHILAVSGLHVGFLFGLLKLLTGKRKTLSLSLFIMAIIYMYGEMTLWSASTVRAVIVLSVGMFSLYVKRPFDLLSSVSTAGLIILVYNPYQLFYIGFQLSFLAMLGIAFLGKPLSFFVGKYLSTSLSVQLAIAPLTAYTFNRFNPISIFINIPIIFISSILVPLCIIALLIENLIGKTPQFFVQIIEGIVKLLVEINSNLTMQGQTSWETSGMNLGILITFYIFLFLVSSEWMRVMIMRNSKREIFKALSYLIIPIIIINIAVFNSFSDDEIVFVSVGQGDCVHIRAAGNDAIIDGGGNRFSNIGKNTLKPYLLKNGSDKLDFALVTHAHMDHYKGISELSEIYEIDKVLIPEMYLKEEKILKDLRTSIGFMSSEKVVHLSKDVRIQAVWPIRGREEASSLDDSNENNMVYIIYYENIKTMVTGDMLEEDELEMLDYYRGTDILKCDVLKVAHHGSETSSSEEFLDEVSPKITIIQVGLNNPLLEK